MLIVKVCRRCGEQKPDSDFSPTSSYLGVSQTRAECKQCNAENARRRRRADPKRFNDAAQKWRKANPDKIRDYVLRHMYGITLKAFQAMEKDQDGRCIICLEKRKLFVDHCHKTGKVRGLLCPKCNGYLGIIKDSVAALRRAIDYLENS